MTANIKVCSTIISVVPDCRRGDGEGKATGDIIGGRADENFKFAGFNCPQRCGRVVVGKCILVEGKGDVGSLARFQLYLIESFQFLVRTIERTPDIVHINLHDLGPLAVACIGDRYCYRDRTVAGNFRFKINKFSSLVKTKGTLIIPGKNHIARRVFYF